MPIQSLRVARRVKIPRWILKMIKKLRIPKRKVLRRTFRQKVQIKKKIPMKVRKSQLKSKKKKKNILMVL